MDPPPDVRPVVDRLAASVESFAGDAWWAGPVFEGLEAGAMLTNADGNRWNLPGEPTVYLAGDLPVALVETGRHRAPGDLSPLGIWRVGVRFDRILDLRRGDVRAAIAAPEPTWFLDRARTTAVASGIRALGLCDAMLVPTAGMPDHMTRANIVVFLPGTQAAPSWLEGSRLEMVLRPERTMPDLVGPVRLPPAPMRDIVLRDGRGMISGGPGTVGLRLQGACNPDHFRGARQPG